ncbi:MAG TPA: penicillin acylase family protein [Myxococcota bacterium]|jgi:penicillin amidase|nr:penicillin acylase family protein [Myxococcota bacterium]
MALRLLRDAAGRRRSGTSPRLCAANLPRLDGRVEIVRDLRGVPHVYADEERDLYAVLGWLQAADRFFLMDVIRHVGGGRLTELVGDVPIPVPREILGPGGSLAAVDRFVRPLDFEAEAVRDHARLAPRARACIDAFAEGANAALHAMDGVYPSEYVLLGRVRPWAPEDALLVQRTSGFVVTLVNLDNELTFDAVRSAGGDALARRLYPDAPWENAPTSYAARGGEPPEPPVHLPAGGSNNWAVSARRSASGAPIVANDPHVPVIPLPTYWYHAHLECPAYRVQGGVFPGAPLFGFGHNGHLAWGCTTAFRDAWDLFRIHRSPGDPTQYRTPGGFGRLERHHERRRSRFGGEVEIAWERCEHGIVYPGWKHHDGIDLALRQVPVDLARYVEGYLDLVASTTVAAHRAALAAMNEGPFDFNHVYGHRDGHVGWEVFGRLPRRRLDGLFVRDAHDPEAQWEGFLAFDEMPKRFDPPEGYLATANAATTPAVAPVLATHAHFEPRLRQERIERVLAARSDHDAHAMTALQGDVTADYAPPLRDALLSLLGGIAPPPAREGRALALLASFDGRFGVGSAGAAIFFFTQQELVRRCFVPLLGPRVGRRFGASRRAVPRLQRMLLDPADPLRGDVATAAGRPLDDLARGAFRAAIARIVRICGDDLDGWAWGRIQRARLGGILAELPGVGARFVALDAPFPGDDYTVSPSRSLDEGHRLRALVTGTSRFVCDLARPDEAWFSHSSGPRGDKGSVWHANLCGPWTRFETFRSALWRPHEVPDAVERLVVEAP